MVLFADFDLLESVNKLDQKVEYVTKLATDTNSTVDDKLFIILRFLF